MTAITITPNRISPNRIQASRIPATRIPATRSTTGPSRVRTSSRPAAVVYWRRRVAALALGLGLVAVGSEAASAVVAGVSHSSGPASIHYVVRPGDTLWSIARTVAPNEDPRAVVDLLLEAHGSAMIQPGDVIDWAG